MRVFIDDQIFRLQSRGGISRYFVELMRAFRGDPSLDVCLTGGETWARNRHLFEAGYGRRLPSPMGQRRQVLRIANRLRSARAADVVHHTYYDRTYLSRGRTAVRRVTTVHDMIPELLPQWFTDESPHVDKRAHVDAADLILCVSESTKRDLIKVFGEPSAPVVVTPLGVDRSFRSPTPKPASLPDRYVLFVGSRSAYKDFDVLTRALAEADGMDGVDLIAVGGGALDTTEMADLARLGLTDRVRQWAPNDEELVGAYNHALCFVFPSRYEGFGLPTLEAMSASCPVILAASSSHPEVAGDAGVYFEPGDHAELATRLEAVCQDEQLRDTLVNRGRERAAQFSWSRTARLTVEAYAEGHSDSG